MTEITKAAEPKPLQLIKNGVVAMSDQLTSVLPPHVSVERFAQVVCTAVANSDQLAEVAMTPTGRQSIFIACVQCATDGLIPDGREAALVKYGGTATYMPMAAGLIKLMHQAGTAKDIACELIYEKELEQERFRYRQTSDGVDFHHNPIMFGERGKPIGVYACMRTPDGGFYIAVCDEAEVMRAKASSRGKNTPWNGPHHLSMWKKTALKRLAKIAPTSERLLNVIDHDNETFHEIEPIAEKPKMLDRLREAKEPKAIAPQDDPETPPTDEPDVMEGEIIDGEGLAQGYDLPVLEDRISAAQAVAYATAWAALYKASNKADRDALWAQTEDAVDRVGKISSKALDICNDALNSPAE